MGIEVKVGRHDIGRDLFNATFGRESLVAGAIAGRDVRFAAADGTTTDDDGIGVMGLELSMVVVGNEGIEDRDVRFAVTRGWNDGVGARAVELSESDRTEREQGLGVGWSESDRTERERGLGMGWSKSDRTEREQCLGMGWSKSDRTERERGLGAVERWLSGWRREKRDKYSCYGYLEFQVFSIFGLRRDKKILNWK